MTTVAEFIAYLQTLPAETVVTVAENVDTGYASYVTFNNLKLPTEFRLTNSGNFEFLSSFSDNLEFFSHTPELQLGSR